MNKRGLGKGLGALFEMGQPEEGNIEAKGQVELPLSSIDVNVNQARKTFSQPQMDELVESIKRHGVIQPVLVRRNGSRYIIIAGERRFRAAAIAGMTSIPAVIKEAEDVSAQDFMEISLIENLQRENLNPIEEAWGIKEVMDKYDMTQEQIASRLSKSRPYIANSLRLLALEADVIELVKAEKLSAGHARAIAALPAGKQIQAAEAAARDGLSVRQIEGLARRMQANAKQEVKAAPKSPEFTGFEDKLRMLLGTKVAIKGSTEKGSIQIDYYSEEDLFRLYDLLVSTAQEE